MRTAPWRDLWTPRNPLALALSASWFAGFLWALWGTARRFAELGADAGVDASYATALFRLGLVRGVILGASLTMSWCFLASYLRKRAAADDKPARGTGPTLSA